MKNVIIFSLLIFLLISNKTFSQLYFEDNFDYTTGELHSQTSNWSELTGGSYSVNVISGSLEYSGYVSNNIGNKIFIDCTTSDRATISREFPKLFNDGDKIYVSFLMRVLDVSDLEEYDSEGNYFFRLTPGGSVFRNYIYIKQGSVSNSFQLGFGKTSTKNYVNINLNIGQTYLIVSSYEFIAGGSNDISKFWINPDLSGTEPTPDLTITEAADPDSIKYIYFSQKRYAGNIEIDGIRAGSSWLDSPLPVELTNFNCSQDGDNIKLSWTTSTEINNCCFEIERKFKNKSDWETIGSINGFGNSNAPKEYFFTDKFTKPSTEYSYRLKQIDFDGSFSYSNIISYTTSAINKFVLYQNYPNPFNPRTTIKYELPEDSFVKIQIIDILGSEIMQLENKYKESGTHEIELNASNLASGIYFYKIDTGNFIDTKKFLILK